MPTTTIYQDLFDHNDWANKKLFDTCRDLSDADLDRPREMGFGTLRNTLFHNLEAELIWLERWQGKDWRPLQLDAEGLSVDAIAEAASTTAATRNALIQKESESGFRRVVAFADSQQEQWEFPIGWLLNHVSNHGIHHRAQALNFLRFLDRKFAGGLDYLFYKLAAPSCDLPSESVSPLREYGLEVQTSQGDRAAFDAEQIKFYFAYNDWANGQVLNAAGNLSDAQLDQEIEMGMGSLRKNLQHILDAERWWLANWETDHSPFPRGEDPRSLQQITDLAEEIATNRNAFVARLNEDSAQRLVNVTAGGPVTCFPVIESLLQLCGHSTHHRAQCINMLRQLGMSPPGIDLIVWLRDNQSQS